MGTVSKRLLLFLVYAREECFVPHDWSAALLSSAPKVLAVSLFELMASSLCRHTEIRRRH
jgi:hypothetical protein